MKVSVLAALSFLATVSSLAASDFPDEAEVQKRLHPGMTEQQVIVVFGGPSHRTSERRTGDYLSYVPSVHLLTKDAEGYIGFRVHLVGGLVQDWQPILGNPSYEPPHLPPELRWLKIFFLVVVGAAFLHGILRTFDRTMTEEEMLRKAFEERTIPTQKLPRDFAFITRDTTVEEVTERLGPCSARREHEALGLHCFVGQ